MMLDKIGALSGPPGHSLTQPQGKWAWDKPAVYPDPNDAIDHVIQKLETTNGQEDMLKLMTAGITVEELVNQIALKGFMGGFFTPDVAELIKPALALYLMNLADDNGFMPQVFVAKEGDDPEVDDEKFFSIMKQRNPETFNEMNEQLNRNVRLEEQLAIEESEGFPEEEPNFINTPEPVAEEEIMPAEMMQEEEVQ